MAGRIGDLSPDSTGWFQCGEEKLARIDLSGEPSQWKILSVVELPKKNVAAIRPTEPGVFVLLTGLPDGVTTKIKQHIHMADTALEMLDARGDSPKWYPPLGVSPNARFLNVIGKHAYVAFSPGGGNECVVAPLEGQHFEIFDLSDPGKIRKVGEWSPGQPNRALLLFQNPQRPNLVASVEARMGVGVHFCDFKDPARPECLVSLPTNGAGSGDRILAWGDRALYTAGLNGIWYDLSDPRSPKKLGEWFNRQWFRAMHVYGEWAVVAGWTGGGQLVDFRDPWNSKVVGLVPFSAAWGPRVYGWKGDTLVVTDISNPDHLTTLGQSLLRPPEGSRETWADGGVLYAIGEKGKEGGTLVIWDVSDPTKVRELGRLTHADLKIGRTEGHWTAHGKALTASRGIVMITSLHAGAPQIIDARDPREPKLLGHLPTEPGEATDSSPDGAWFYIKYWNAPGEAWDLSVPEKPRLVWKETPGGEAGMKSWVAGLPKGEVLLAPRQAHLKVVTVPRPSQVPEGQITWH
jgi:hypothetical protein